MRYATGWEPDVSDIPEFPSPWTAHRAAVGCQGWRTGEIEIVENRAVATGGSVCPIAVMWRIIGFFLSREYEVRLSTSYSFLFILNFTEFIPIRIENYLRA